MKHFQINILRQVFSIFGVINHFKNDLCYKGFGIFYNKAKGGVIAIQYLLYQLPV